MGHGRKHGQGGDVTGVHDGKMCRKGGVWAWVTHIFDVAQVGKVTFTLPSRDATNL